MGAVPDTKDISVTLDLALRVGEVLLSSGAGAADVTATMLSVTTACGLRNCEVDVTFTALTLGYQPGPETVSHTQIRAVRFRATDYSNLTAVEHLVRALVDGEINRDDARAQLVAISSARHRYPRWAVTLGWGLMAVGVSLFIGGDWKVSVIAFAVAVTIDLLNRTMSRRRVPTFYQQVAGGLVATLVAVAAVAAHLQVDPSRVVTVGIIMLLAGIAFVGAVQDALTSFYVTSGARGLEALLLTGGIIAGVSGGLAVADRAGVTVVFTPVSATWNDLPTALIGSALTASAFAFSSYAPVRALGPIALVGVLGQLVYRFIVLQGFGIAWASAIAAVAIGAVAYSLSGRFRVPSLVVVVSGITPLLPGLSIYKGLYLMTRGVNGGLVSLATALAIAIALAAGVILGEYLAQPLKREARRLEQRLAGPRLVGPWRPRSPRRVRRERSSRRGRDRQPGASRQSAHDDRNAPAERADDDPAARDARRGAS
ncbi:MAG: threonine/serine ThrE exporter family protein [Nocardioidaceae bacterium]